MKKLIMLALALILLCGSACAETAREYALWLEEALPGSAFSDTQVPDFVERYLGADYDFIARADAGRGSYIAGVRRADAPALPEDAYASSAGSFETAVFRVLDDAGNIYYDFVLADGVQIQAYDGLRHIVIQVDAAGEYTPFGGYGSKVFLAADSHYRAQLDYAQQKGFSMEDEGRVQLCLTVHNIESWRMGATKEPTTFYLDAEIPTDLTGERYLDEAAMIRHTRIPVGLQLRDGEDIRELVLSTDGVKGVELYDLHRLYEAGAGWDALVDIAEAALGYRPGDMDFMGKKSLRAALEWQDGCVVIDDEARLGKLDAMLGKADFSVGSVNCPSPCFLTLEFEDGTAASIAVAINSFDLFFYNGVHFTAGDGELIELFDLKNTKLYQDIFGG